MAEQLLRITQTRSLIGRPQDQRDTVRSLGLKRIRHTVEQPDRPEIRGMLNKVPHLVSWEAADGSSAGEQVADASEGNTQDRTQP
jgi:large subunit ribosomal protein L30